MLIAEANLIRRQIAQMLIQNRFTRIETIGDGSHSRHEIIRAFYLSLAHEFWVTKALNAKAREHFSSAAKHPDKQRFFESMTTDQDAKLNEGIINVARNIEYICSQSLFVYLLPRGSNLIHLTKIEPRSDPHHYAVSDRLNEYDIAVRNHTAVDCTSTIAASTYLDFLKGLTLSPASDYWRKVYSFLALDYPPFDPDRIEFDSPKSVLLQKGKEIQTGAQRNETSEVNPGFPSWVWILVWLAFLLFAAIMLS